MINEIIQCYTSIGIFKYCKYANIHVIQARVQCAGNSDGMCINMEKHQLYTRITTCKQIIVYTQLRVELVAKYTGDKYTV